MPYKNTLNDSISTYNGNTTSSPYTNENGVHLVADLMLILYDHKAYMSWECQSLWFFLTILHKMLTIILLVA